MRGTIRRKHKRRFLKAIEELNAVIEEVRLYQPEANYYVEGSEVHLMIGPSHTEDRHVTAQPHNSALSKMLRHADCGAW